MKDELSYNEIELALTVLCRMQITAVQNLNQHDAKRSALTARCQAISDMIEEMEVLMVKAKEANPCR